MDKNASLFDFSWTGSGKYVPHVALGALALGAGGRLIKSMADSARGRTDQAPEKIEAVENDTSSIPFEVTPEEAEELERRGVKVKRLMGKTAATWLDVIHPRTALARAFSPSAQKPSASFPRAIGYGALVTGMGIGGWALADKIIDKMRENAVKSDIELVESRIKKVLDDEPEDQDLPVHAQMKAAEDAYFSGGMQKVAITGPVWNALAALGLFAGGAGVLAGLGGYARSREASKPGQKAKQLKRLFRSRKADTANLRAVPVLRVQDGDRTEEEEEPEVVVREAPAQQQTPYSPAPAPVVIDPQAGSPADEARQNRPANPYQWF